MAGSLPKKGRIACRSGDCPCGKIKEVLRFGILNWTLGQRQIARGCSIGLGPSTIICNEPKVLESSARSGGLG